jgi:uncharacterized protein (UPF0332 family)
MSIQYGDFMLSAESMHQAASAEIDFRNSVSRAYYAAFHSCLPIGDKLPGFADEIGGEHARLISKLEGKAVCAKTRNQDMSIRSVGYLLRQVRQLRVEADYKLDAHVDSRLSATAVQQAKQIVEKSESILAKWE